MQVQVLFPALKLQRKLELFSLAFDVSVLYAGLVSMMESELYLSMRKYLKPQNGVK